MFDCSQVHCRLQPVLVTEDDNIAGCGVGTLLRPKDLVTHVLNYLRDSKEIIG